MPLVAAIPAFLGTAAGASIASAGIGAAASLYSTSQANKSVNKQIANSQATTAQVLAQQEATKQQARSDYAPAVGTGNAALDALAKQYGLGGMGGGAAGSPDYLAYGRDPRNADALAWAQAGGGDPTKGADQTLEERLAYHFQNSGQKEGREMPTVAATAANDAPAGPMSAPAPTYTRPDQGSAPGSDAFFGNYEETEDYKFLRDKNLKAVNNNFGARGVLRSGGAARELMREASALSSLDKNQWFGRQNTLYQSALQQFNLDRANTNDNFTSDRGYGTSMWADARDYATGRADTKTGDLFKLAGVGQSALGAVTGAGSSAAANAGNAAMAGADGVNSLYQAKSANNSALAGALTGFGQSALSAAGGSRGYTPVPTSTVYDAAQYPSYRTPPFNPGALTTMPQVRF